MVEIEVSTTDDENENIEDPLSMLLREMGISNAMMEAAVRDDMLMKTLNLRT
jgi:hypothetical protein